MQAAGGSAEICEALFGGGAQAWGRFEEQARNEGSPKDLLAVHGLGDAVPFEGGGSGKEGLEGGAGGVLVGQFGKGYKRCQFRAGKGSAEDLDKVAAGEVNGGCRAVVRSGCGGVGVGSGGGLRFRAEKVDDAGDGGLPGFARRCAGGKALGVERVKRSSASAG